MADLGTALHEFFASLLADPLYLLLLMGLVALVLVAVIAIHIHRIHSQEIFVHQAWGANWKGR